MKDQKTIMVIHADDHQIVRNTVKSLIANKAPHIEFVGEATSYQELFSALANVECDLLLLDGEIIGGSTSQYLPFIRTKYPGLKIILFWVAADIDSLTKWIHLLDGHLNLGVDSDELIYAIDIAMRGEKYFTIPVFAIHRDS